MGTTEAESWEGKHTTKTLKGAVITVLQESLSHGSHLVTGYNPNFVQLTYKPKKIFQI